MAQIPLSFASEDNGTWAQMGTWLKFADLPSNDTIIFEAHNGGVVDWYLVLQTGGSVLAAWSYRGNLITVQCTGPTLLNPGSWYWVACSVGGGGGSGQILGQVIGPGGATDGLKTATMPPGPTHTEETVDCDVGWGVHLQAVYDDWPNAAGWEMKGLGLKTALGTVHHVGDVGVLSAPSSDPSPSGYAALYLCNQSIGPLSTLTDATGNHYDMLPGPNGAAIVADSPY